jgi:peptidoglycan/LPS O-acetylase OafA/YrhL
LQVLGEVRVALELYFYALAPWVLRSKVRTVLFTYVGVLWYLYCSFSGKSDVWFLYDAFPASILYFGLGAASWWLAKGERGALLAIVPACIATIYLKQFVDGSVVLLFAMALPLLFELTKNCNWDREIGELSYLVYIVHYPAIEILTPYFDQSYLWVVTVGFSVSMAVLLHVLLERPLDRWRSTWYLRSQYELEIGSVVASANVAR